MNIIVLVLFTVAFCLSSAIIVDYDNIPLESLTMEWGIQGMYTGNGASQVSVDLKFSRDISGVKEPEFAVTEVEMAIFETGNFYKLGYFPTGSTEKKFCCDEAAIQAGVCKISNSIIVPKDARDEVSVWKIVFPENDNEVVLKETYKTVKTGLHFILFSRCDEGKGDVHFSGTSEWLNPYGFFDACYYGALPFTGIMALLYLALALFWSIHAMCYIKEIHGVQVWITFVLGVALVEAALKYFEFKVWNDDGRRSLALLLATIFFGTLKNAAARFILLIVSLGYGIVKPSLGSLMPRCYCLTFVYFSFAFAQSLVEENSHGMLNPFLMYLLILPVALLNVIFFTLTFNALSSTIGQLESRSQSTKLWLFTTFKKLLGIALFIAGAWYMFYFFQIFTHHFDPSYAGDWNSRWIYMSFLEAWFFFIFLIVSILWRPSKNTRQYAYHQELPSSDDGGGIMQVAQDREEYLDGLEAEI